MEFSKIEAFLNDQAYFQPAATGTTNDNRPSLDYIENNFQAPNDEMVKYTITVPFYDSQSVDITRTEAVLLDKLSIFQKGEFANVIKEVEHLTDSMVWHPSMNEMPPEVTGLVLKNYPKTWQRELNAWMTADGHTDAFRHAVWNALMTKHFGLKFAAAYGTAHEGVPGNSKTREAMDLYNNLVGRFIAVSNPRATDTQLGGLVLRALRRGTLVVIDARGKTSVE